MLGVLHERMAVENLAQLWWGPVILQAGVVCSVWRVHGKDGIQIDVVEGEGEEKCVPCAKYLSGLLEDNESGDPAKQGLWFRASTGGKVHPDELTIPLQLPQVTPHSFSGNMRKVAQKLAGRNKLDSYGLSSLHVKTHGLLAGPRDENRITANWDACVYGQDFWIIEIGAEGIFAQQVQFCNEAREAGLTAAQFLALSQKDQDRYSYLIYGKVKFSRDITLSGPLPLDPVYGGKFPIHDLYGWAFSYTGDEAQTIVHNVVNTYRTMYRYKLMITQSGLHGTPVATAIYLIEQAIYWQLGGSYWVPNRECGHQISFDGSSVSPKPGNIDAPIAVYYRGDQEVVFRYVDLASVAVPESTSGLFVPHQCTDFFLNSDDCSPGCVGASLADLSGVQEWISSRTEHSFGYTSPLTFTEAKTYTASSKQTVEFGSAGPGGYSFPPKSVEDLESTLSGLWQSCPKCRWGGETNAYVYAPFQIWWILYNQIMESGPTHTISDTVILPWTDREAVYHFRYTHHQTTTTITYTFGADGNKTDSITYVRAPFRTPWEYTVTHHAMDSWGVDGVGHGMYRASDYNRGFTQVTESPKTTYRMQLMLAAQSAFTIFDLPDLRASEFLGAQSCLGDFIVDALVGAFDPGKWIASRNGHGGICGTMGYNLGLDTDTTIFESPVTLNDFNLFSAAAIGDEMEGTRAV